MIDILVNQKYQLGTAIGKGLFSDVFEGTNSLSNQKVAIKLEHENMSYPQIKFESNLLKHLNGCLGIPMHQWSGKDNVYNVLVMDRLGENLGTLKKRCGGRFSLKTTLMIADQLLAVFESFHDRGVIHRDIKPENFCQGYGREGCYIFAIDFGLGKKIISKKEVDGEMVEVHIKHQTGKSLLGKMLYASIHNLNQEEMSRRDDLESLMYMFLYMVVGELPWLKYTSAQLPKDQRQAKILQMKKAFLENKQFWKHRWVTVNHRNDLESVPLPQELWDIMKMIRELEFEERPDYNKYRSIVRGMMVSYDIDYDHIFDWMLIEGVKDYIGTQNMLSDLNGLEKYDHESNEAEVKDLLDLYFKKPELVEHRFRMIEEQNMRYDEMLMPSINIESHVNVQKMMGGMEERNERKRQKRKNSAQRKTRKGQKENGDCTLV